MGFTFKTYFLISLLWTISDWEQVILNYKSIKFLIYSSIGFVKRRTIPY